MPSRTFSQCTYNFIYFKYTSPQKVDHTTQDILKNKSAKIKITYPSYKTLPPIQNLYSNR